MEIRPVDPELYLSVFFLDSIEIFKNKLLLDDMHFIREND